MYQLISVKYCFHSQKCLPILTDIFINWIYIALVNVLVYFILYIEKQQNKRKNCKKKFGKSKYFHTKIFCILKQF